MDWEEVQQEEIDSAISDVLAEPEIVSGMREAGVSADELKKEIKKRREDLESAYSAEFSRLQDFEQHAEAMQKMFAAEARRVTPRKILLFLRSLGGIAISLTAAIVALGLGGPIWKISGILILIAVFFIPGRAVYRKVHGSRRENIPAAETSRYSVLMKNRETAWDEWRFTLRTRAVSGLLREEINRRKPSYSLTLDISDPKGLAELEDPQFLIAVPAVYEIDQLISTMPGGSIGISGPRGVGKTTLLRHFCSKEHAPVAEYLTENPPVRVLVPAPVKYDAREFVLLLFSRVCGAVAPENILSQNPRRDDEEGPAAYTPLDLGILTALTFAGCWGVFLLITSVIGWKPPANLAPAIILIFASCLGSVFWTIHRGRHRRGADEFSRIAAVHGKDVAEASALLRGLAYQQSVSRTWSTGVKIPVGLEAGVSANTTMTEKPMAFPEIVARLNDFLRTLAVNRKIFIGIDELDKIDSDDQVYQFINDIKGIFGREDCFYLISVSNNAMSSFERRGLPVRDAFDSSLDTVVDLRPADLSMSRILMRRRVIGMPEAFLCLCHVISGGLPRDLIRAARDLVSLAKGKQESGRTLEALTRAMVRADLARKIHAMEVAAQRIDFEPNVGLFICTLHEALDRVPEPTSDSLLDEVDRIAGGISSSASDPDAVRSAHEELNHLSLEVAAYIYFCSTLIGMFNDSLVQEAVERLSFGAGDGCLSRLAQVRSEFTVNPRLAWVTISSFRKAHGLAAKPYPEPVPVVARAGSGAR
ncbi:hypothetical protein ACH47Z_24110 [Streptomyces sp. NPDC020192]|uniref:hypothetical protein n=1 Tax=Streptomyces sp. NPDC020192 TaxID=3365066 RepID=UPI0037BDB564